MFHILLLHFAEHPEGTPAWFFALRKWRAEDEERFFAGKNLFWLRKMQ